AARYCGDGVAAGAAVARLAHVEEGAEGPDGARAARACGQPAPVVAPGPPEESLDLGDEARAPGGAVADRMEIPARTEVGLDVAPPRDLLELAHPDAHLVVALVVECRRARARREALEPEARRVDLLEVFPRQPADERAPGSRHLDEPVARELREADANWRLRDAHAVGEIALHEWRPLGELARDDQLAEEIGDPLLHRAPRQPPEVDGV